MTEQTNLGNSFNKLLGFSFFRYRGVLMERKEGHFLCMGAPCKTLFDADKVIDGSIKAIEKSKNRIKK